MSDGVERSPITMRVLSILCLLFFGIARIGYVLQDVFYSLYFPSIGYLLAIIGGALLAFWNVFWYMVGFVFGLFYKPNRLKPLLLLGSAIIFVGALLSGFVFTPMMVLILSLISNSMVIPTGIFVFIVIRKEQNYKKNEIE